MKSNQWKIRNVNIVHKGEFKFEDYLERKLKRMIAEESRRLGITKN
ncbi:hypothetical protein [Tenuibacillus multivorans]|uniref:Uncharacterized protein n=1 Tax=Tenuibacillus multivorans TaxID=237069 RepID=A0A1G9XQB0_9BACI|nr:hypothetical protein [Tenuibacillus multivorans]GEL75772.1 hypothetical protein TMU01_00070 [Tenuibacillus multivorans]SDM98964.1 hypothetical protein SAMN05216498_1066 [Tenuibacillus multivorans]